MTSGNYKVHVYQFNAPTVTCTVFKKKNSDHIPNSVLNYLFVHVHLNHFRIHNIAEKETTFRRNFLKCSILKVYPL